MSLLLALALQSVVVEPVPDEEQQIVVIGQKLKNWRGFLQYKKGVPVCKSKRSTGDKAIDKIGCDAMIACFPKYQAELDAFAKKAKTKAKYSQISKPTYEKIGQCVVEKRDAGIDALAAQRAALQ